MTAQTLLKELFDQRIQSRLVENQLILRAIKKWSRKYVASLFCLDQEQRDLALFWPRLEQC